MYKSTTCNDSRSARSDPTGTHSASSVGRVALAVGHSPKGWKKPPFDPKTGKRSSHSDPTTWSTFADAVVAFQAGNYDGIGFVFTPTDPYVGVDLDNCRDPSTGAIQVWAMEIISDLNSYTEVSPSETGVKILSRGKLPPKGRVKILDNGKIEFYESHLLPWTTNVLAIGITASSISDLATLTSEARTAYDGHVSATAAARAATADFYDKVAAMHGGAGAGSDMIATIRAFAQSSGDANVYVLAQIPPPAIPDAYVTHRPRLQEPRRLAFHARPVSAGHATRLRG